MNYYHKYKKYKRKYMKLLELESCGTSISEFEKMPLKNKKYCVRNWYCITEI